MKRKTKNGPAALLFLLCLRAWHTRQATATRAAQICADGSTQPRLPHTTPLSRENGKIGVYKRHTRDTHLVSLSSFQRKQNTRKRKRTAEKGARHFKLSLDSSNFMHFHFHFPFSRPLSFFEMKSSIKKKKRFRPDEIPNRGTLMLNEFHARKNPINSADMHSGACTQQRALPRLFFAMPSYV